MSLPAPTIALLVVPPILMLAGTLVWAVRNWNREP